MDDINPYAPPEAELTLHPSGPPALWNPDAAGIWSVVLSPVLGASLVWLNWRAIGDVPKARVALFWLLASIVFTVLVFLTGRTGFTLLFLILWYFGAQRPQTRYVKKTWPGGYPRKSWRWPLLCALGGLLGLIGFGILAETLGLAIP